jgi:hypothetical protein
VIEPSDGRLDVPLAPVRPAATDRRRARTVLVAGLVLAVGSIGLAALSRDDDRRIAEAATPGATVGAAPASAETSPAASAALSPAPTSRREEGFLPLQNQRLAGAAITTLVRRDGDDAEVLAWRPGDPELRPLRRFSGAFGGRGKAPAIATLSPDARSLLIVEIKAGSIEGREHARLVTADGGIAWEADEVTGLGGVVWSADSGSMVIPGSPGRWWLVTVDRSGAAIGRELSIDAAPAPTAAPSVGAPWVRVVPVGFSEDGRWVYGARVDIGRGLIEATTRVAIDDGTVERIGDFNSTGPERLDERARGFLDPTTGRSVMFGANAAIPGGPPTIEVKEPDGTIAYRIEGRVVYATAWTDDGRLLVLDADGLPFPTGLRLRLVDRDGDVQGTLLETGPVAGGGVIGVANGFVHLVFATDRPANGLQVVVVRIADGATSALVAGSPDGILAGGLLP